jgi:hypothetical protein
MPWYLRLLAADGLEHSGFHLVTPGLDESFHLRIDRLAERGMQLFIVLVNLTALRAISQM